MIHINDKQMVAVFGTGDICMAPIQSDTNANLLGLCDQAPREIGSVGDYLEGDVVSLDVFPILLQFDKPECIDALIKALEAVKEQFTT